jgi:7-carboxy-7-deazaguanine synthase
MLKVNEIFHSIQGESSHAGRPCVFVRLTGCNLRCAWCDTEYAFYGGQELSIDEVIRNVAQFDCRLVEVTGGEPLMQPDAIDLMKRLLDEGYEVMLETGGSLPVDKVPPEVIKIVDFKAPGSGMAQKNRWSILDDLAPHDELKFVIADREDYTWARARVEEYDLAPRCTVLFSPVFGNLELSTLAGWILTDKLPVRLQSQLHKHIWDPDAKGV